MGPLGWQETIVIFVLALLLFGPKKLPELGKNLAKALGEFRRASNELKDTWHREMAAVERETQDIKKEAESISQVTSQYDYESSYQYDSSYDYGGYGYSDGTSESYNSSTTPTTETADAAAGAVEGTAEGDSAAVAADAAPATEAAHPTPVEDPNAAGAAQAR